MTKNYLLKIFSKKTILLSVLLSILFAQNSFAFSEENRTKITFFYSNTCAHCAKEAVFLNKLEKKYPDIILNKLAVTEIGNTDRLKEMYERYNIPSDLQGLIPITFISEKYFLGYNSDITTGKQIEKYILSLQVNNSPGDTNIVQKFYESTNKIETRTKLNLPVIGEIDLSKFSPLGLAVILGTLDGFNPCAMVALGFLLATLISAHNRKRLILVGGIFIFISGLVYFIFISAWVNLFLVLENIKIITNLVGVIIVLFSLFLLKDYFENIVCRLCDVQQKNNNIFSRIEKSLFERMNKLLSKDVPLIALLFGVSIIAAGINLIELVCSFGFPLAFTKTLVEMHLSTFFYYFSILVYIFFYMLDDFIIFLIAVWTLKITQFSEKYLKLIKLISAIALLILGIIIFIRPDILSFG